MPGQTVDGAAPDATNPDPAHPGMTVSRFHQTDYCIDNPAESWDDVHQEVDGGAMDGFAARAGAVDPTNDPSGTRALGYYDESDLPYDYMAGTAYGVTSNVVPPQRDAALPALTHRDANAVPPLDMFDFAHPDLTVPALPAATVDQAAADACGAKYPGK